MKREHHTPPPPITDPGMWKSLLNLLYRLERDEEFRWLKAVRDEVCEPEEPRPRRAA